MWVVLVIIHLYLLAASAFKAYLCFISLSRGETKYKYMASPFPVYTILLPLYKEANMIPKIVKSMDGLLYPKDKLDIIFVLESDDHDTIEAVRTAKLPSHWKYIVVPDTEPKTKPKACNAALPFARGEYLTIYDAEDIPDPDQLQKAVSVFRQLPEEYACLQASLTYFNSKENWLTRMFYLEYTFWFNFLIIGLSRNNLPVPLGGTSNHFKINILRDLGGWNPWNVTEDCEIGLKLAAAGYEIGHLPSYTHEEAMNNYWGWIKQRTRWILGYMQTFISYGLKSTSIYNTKGLKGLLVVFLFIFGTPVFSLLTAPLYALFFAWLVFDPAWIQVLFPEPWTWYLSWACLVFGNISTIGFHIYSVWKKGERRLALWGLTLPVYWILHSVAAWRALYKLLTRDGRWEKSTHGKSKIEFKGK